MNIVESINNARKKNINDDVILQEIRKQNPQKEEFFKRAEISGASSTAILNEIIRQNKISELEKTPLDNGVNLPEKPTDETKLWVRIFITLGLTSFCALSFAFFYRAFFAPKLRSIEPQIIEKQIFMPRAENPSIKMYPEKDNIERFAIVNDEELPMNLRKIIREKGLEDELIRVIVEDQRTENEVKIANLEDFFNIFKIGYPEDFFVKINKGLDLFIYTKDDISGLGFVAKYIKDDENSKEDITWNLLRKWEKEMPKNFNDFFAFWGQEISYDEMEFSESAHQGINMPRSYTIRYKEGSGGSGIYYSLTEDRLLFATSLDCVKILIERYYDITK